MAVEIRLHRVAALALALLIALPACAAASWQPRFGVEAGPNLGRMSSTGLIGSEQHWKLGGSAGLLASWDLVPGWSLEAAPGWERPVARGTGTITLSSGGTVVDRMGFDQTIRLDRIALPVRAAFHPRGSGWSLEGGLSASWLAHADRDAETTSSGAAAVTMLAPVRPRGTPGAAIFEAVGTFNSADWTNNFHRWDASAIAGVGWDHPLASHVMRVRARWQQGLTDIGKFDQVVRVSAASATVGLLW